jgi:hypothetical protein
MAYNPIHDYRAKDALPSGSDQKVSRGADLSDEFEAIGEALKSSALLTSCKFNGSAITYGYNVSGVQSLGGGAWRVNFAEAINPDGDTSAGDFAAVVTPYTTNGRMVIATITDQRESYVDIAFRELNGSDWSAPSTQGFAFILLDQVPA